MFKPEGPISTSTEDILGRTAFASRLADSITQWESKDSLVIGLYGTWGTGKSSVINLVKEHLYSLPDGKSPTVIEFNPWMVSGQQQLLTHFFEQIAIELEIQNQESEDQATAFKLRQYAALLLALPEKSDLQNTLQRVLSAGGLVSLVGGFLIDKLASAWWGNILVILGIILIILRLSGRFLEGIARYYDNRAIANRKSIAAKKLEIVEVLKTRSRKLLIILDDIDRLSEVEVKELIRLAKVNSDFPQTVFLLACDRTIVEKHLEDSAKSISGREYLEKIIQVNFDLPQTRRWRIEKYLFSQLDESLERLPQGWQKYFDSNRWANLYHSGFKDFFPTIRSIKRYVNSLAFHLSMIEKHGVLEANPIDFMAIECIRVFCPEFYHFMRQNKELFAYIDSDSMSDYGHRQREERLKLLKEGLSLIPESKRESVSEIVKWTFPGPLDNTIYGGTWISSWNKGLMARSPEYFDVYFSLTPGGDEGALSQYDLVQLLDAAGNLSRFEELLREHIERGTIRTVLERLHDYTSGEEAIPEEHIGTVILSLFNIADDLPTEERSFSDFGASMDVMRILHQLGKRIGDGAKFKYIVLPAIKAAKALGGVVEFVSLETPRPDTRKEYYTVPNDSIGELQSACLEKIREYEQQGRLYNHNRLLYILYRWKEWSTDDACKKSIEKYTSSDERLVEFLGKFVHDQRSQTIGEYAIRKERAFGFTNLAGLFDLKTARERLEVIRNSNKQLEEHNQETFDLFFAGIDRAIQRHNNDLSDEPETK